MCGPHIVTYGDKPQPTLVCLHGWLDNSGSFTDVVAALQDHYHIVIPELAGHGSTKSRPSTQFYNLFDDALDLLDQFDQLEIEQYLVLGHSLGGAIASVMAALDPDRCVAIHVIEALGPILAHNVSALEVLTQCRSMPKEVSHSYKNLKHYGRVRSIASKGAPEKFEPIAHRQQFCERDGRSTITLAAYLTRISPLGLSEDQVTELLEAIKCKVTLYLCDRGMTEVHEDVLLRCGRVADCTVTNLVSDHYPHIGSDQPAFDTIIASLLSERTRLTDK